MPSPKRAPTTFRPDLQGLRAIASLLVAVFHTWIGTVSGGVDVFFVVTGMLITATLMRNVDRTGGIDLWRYLRRLAGTLFPMAGLVLLVVTVGILVWMPPFQWRVLFGDVVASATYWQNWHLAGQATDYLAHSATKSPLQHFWAMSVQGQFYLLWAAVVALGVGLAKLVPGWSVRRAVLGVVGLVTVASFAWALVSVAQRPVVAYYDTFARLWEFGLGAGVALLVTGRVLPRGWRTTLGLVGLGALLTAGLAPVEWHYPGHVALWPALGATALLLSHQPEAEHPGPVTRLLASRPLVWLGGYSYGLYLWSWPLLVAAQMVMGDTAELGWWTGIITIGIAILLGWGSMRLLPLLQRRLEHRVPSWRARIVVPAATALVPVLAIVGVVVPTVQDAMRQQRFDARGGVAAEPFHDVDELQAELESSLSATRLPPLFPGFGEEGRALEWVVDQCATVTERNLDDCHFAGDSSAIAEIMVVGDSHAVSWLPAIRAAAEGRANVQAAGREQCPVSLVPVANEWAGIDAHVACLEHLEWVLRLIEERQPDLVVMSFGVWHGDRVQGIDDPYAAMNALAEGTLPYLHRLASTGVRVVWLDSPPTTVDPYPCAQARAVSSFHETCRGPLLFEQLLRIANFEAIAHEADVPYVSTLPWFCSLESYDCPLFVRGMAITADGAHLTWGMGEALAPLVAEALDLGSLPYGSRE